MKMIIDYDPMTGISHWTETDEETGYTRYGADQETAPILEANTADYNESHGRFGEFTHVARIPMLMYEAWVAEGKDTDQGFLKKFLNDIGFRKLRTRPGRI